MGFIFDIDNKTVWSPGQRVGEVFVGYVAVLEKVTGTPSGFSFMAADFVDIDIKALTEFHAALTGLLLGTSSVLVHEQVRPTLAIVTVLLRRGGAPPVNDPADVGEGFVDYLTRIDATIGTL